MQVLDRLNVTYRTIKGGFECVHSPSIDLDSVAFSPRPEASHQMSDRVLSNPPDSPTLDRKRSVRRSILPRALSVNRDREPSAGAAADVSQASLDPQAPRTQMSSSSFTVLTAQNTAANEGASAPAGIPITPNMPSSPSFRNRENVIINVSTPRDASEMIVRFEIFIIKVPWLLGLHGIQFRRISGSAWQYSQLGEWQPSPVREKQTLTRVDCQHARS